MVTGVLVPFLFFFWFFYRVFVFFILKKKYCNSMSWPRKKKCIACNHPRFVKIFVVFRLVQGVRLHFFFFYFLCKLFWGGLRETCIFEGKDGATA